ncbi:hypothetical protein B0H13DRAFT_2321751 [Mycena leptocephala]|nr:hypothetical protein B0H13DRAFT_2321751 [Mycena leptocephala]
MAHFTKTVSRLSRDELLSAADNFDLAKTGNVTTLRKRVKNHIDANEHYMDNPRYLRLFSPQQRARYDSHADCLSNLNSDQWRCSWEQRMGF